MILPISSFILVLNNSIPITHHPYQNMKPIYTERFNIKFAKFIIGIQVDITGISLYVPIFVFAVLSTQRCYILIVFLSRYLLNLIVTVDTSTAKPRFTYIKLSSMSLHFIYMLIVTMDNLHFTLNRMRNNI